MIACLGFSINRPPSPLALPFKEATAAMSCSLPVFSQWTIVVLLKYTSPAPCLYVLCFCCLRLDSSPSYVTYPWQSWKFEFAIYWVYIVAFPQVCCRGASIKLVVCLCVFVAHYHNEIIMLYNRNRAQEWEFFIITGLQAVENDKMKVAKQWSF